MPDILDIPPVSQWELTDTDTFTIELEGGQYITLRSTFIDKSYGSGGMDMVLLGQRSGAFGDDEHEFTWTSQEFEAARLKLEDLTTLSQTIHLGLGRGEITGEARTWLLRSHIEEALALCDEDFDNLRTWAAVNPIDGN
jgi:hypothetical protein